jgi:hypothetical protein
MASSAIMHCRLYQPEWVNLSSSSGVAAPAHGQY